MLKTKENSLCKSWNNAEFIEKSQSRIVFQIKCYESFTMATFWALVGSSRLCPKIRSAFLTDLGKPLKILGQKANGKHYKMTINEPQMKQTIDVPTDNTLFN